MELSKRKDADAVAEIEQVLFPCVTCFTSIYFALLRNPRSARTPTPSLRSSRCFFLALLALLGFTTELSKRRDAGAGAEEIEQALC
jgi:hypothetical protein